MSLESATHLDDLVVTNPAAGDLVSQGDDHLRLIKNVLKTSLPGTTAPRYLEQARADLASSSTPALWATTSNYINITGTTPITGFASGTTGQQRLVRFDGVLTLTYHATTLKLPTGANIVTAAGDHALIQCDGTTNSTVVGYFRQDGTVLVPTLPDTGEVTWEMLEDEVFNQTTTTIASDDLVPFADVSDGTTPGIKKVGLVSSLLDLAPGALMAIINEQYASGASVPNAVADAFYVRVLNELVYSRDSLVTLASNNFTLPAGDWLIEWALAFKSTNYTTSKLYDYTNSADVAFSIAHYFDVNRDQSGITQGAARVSIASATAYNIQYKCSNAGVLGIESTYGTAVETQVKISRA